MICPPCRDAADQDSDGLPTLNRCRAAVGLPPLPPAHDPRICADARRTDREIRLHGRECACAHGLTHHPEHDHRTREDQTA
jgi:hypothetical protein